MTMVRKVTISLPDELAEKIDREARSAGISRSELVQEASAHYIAHTTGELERVRAARLSAIEMMREIGELPERDSRPTLEILKEGRDFPNAPLPGSPEREQWEAEVGYAQWRRDLGLGDDDPRL
jgi:predicted transcriptional regulator